MFSKQCVENLKRKRAVKTFKKLSAGWWWFGVCWEEWCYCMSNPENTGGDFFCHISSDYCEYEELTGEYSIRKQEIVQLIEKLIDLGVND